MENFEVSKTQTEDLETEMITDQAQLKKGKRTTLLVSVLLVLAIILCIWVISQVLSTGYISVGGYSLFRVATGSMEPELPIGTLLVSQVTDIHEIEVKDIVNYRSKDPGMLGMVITHRVIGIHQGDDGTLYLETKGDSNQYADGSYVTQSNLIGKVIYSTGEGNIFAGLIQFLTSQVGFLACIVVPCLVLGAVTMRDTIRNLKDEMDEIRKELDEIEKPKESGSLEQQMGEEAYEKLCDRLRTELLEELKQSAAQVNTQEQPGEQRQ